MTEWVALLRGVNVGGANKVPMAELRALAEGLGWRNVRSYIASGNLVFRSEETADTLTGALRDAMAGTMGVDVPVLVLPGDAIRAALARCPFDPEEGRHVHAFFLWSEPALDHDRLAALKAPGEDLRIEGRVAWFHAPEGTGRSKLAQSLDRVITGTAMTGRNLNTLRKLVEMLDEAGPG